MADNFNTKVPLTGNNQPPLTDERAIPQQDGAIPQYAAGISSGQYDALDPIGKTVLSFEKGNFNVLNSLPQLVSSKTSQITQTLIPIIEVALIELLGSNTMYRRSLAQFFPAFDVQGKLNIEFVFNYTVESFIGQDIPVESIQNDANYILQKLQMFKEASITKCEINCNDGLVTIKGSL